MSTRLHIGFLIILFFMPLFGVSAEEEPAAAIEASAFIVDTVVNIDKDIRTLTLRSEDGEESKFTAGPEVRNFDQIKRGDQVMVQYFNAFAITLGSKNGGLREHYTQLEVEIEKQDGKPGEKITRTSTAVGTVVAVDQKNYLLTVKGEEQTVVIRVSKHFDLSGIMVGSEVEVIYIEYYAINVEQASEILGTVTIKSTLLALGIGWEWGQGEFTMYDGSDYTFDIEGISVLDIGVSLIEAEGSVYKVVKPKDMEGEYWAAETGISYGDGVSALTMKNNNDVILKLTTKQRGIRLTLAAQRLKIKNIMPK